MDREKLLKRFSDSDERLLFAKTLDLFFLCEKSFRYTFTDFIDPVKASKFVEVLKNEVVSTLPAVFGGSDVCERKIIGFSPYDEIVPYEEFPIKRLRLTYNPKFSRTLSHRDFLGSILGVGITRAKVGDIFIDSDNVQSQSSACGAFVYVHCDVADYIKANLERVGNASVKVEICDTIYNEPSVVISLDKEETKLTVSSLRLDTVLSAVFRISRGKASSFVEGEKVFVNWALAKSSAKPVNEGDVITLRGLGRAKLVSVEGISKKGKVIINVVKN